MANEITLPGELNSECMTHTHPKKGTANNKLITNPLVNTGHNIATVPPNNTTASQVLYQWSTNIHIHLMICNKYVYNKP